MLRVASYNVENLFSRPKAFNQGDWSIGKPILEAYQKVNGLFEKATYSAGDLQKMRDLLVKLDIYSINGHGAVRRKRSSNPKWAWMRKNRGKFDKEPRDTTKSVEIIAKGRGDWIGWVELATGPADETGVRLTAKVIADVGADIIGIVEAEDRPSLLRFNKLMLDDLYAHVMLIDGNDQRGIDVGIMTRDGFDIERMRSYVDLEDQVGTVFSRDCAHYEVATPGGERLNLLINHFKSQSGGGGPKRERQAKAVRAIVDQLVADNQHVVVMGDLNEGPAAEGTQAESFASLFDNNSPLVDCFGLAGFDLGGRPGTFDSCGLRNRLDYIFISESLQPAFVAGGIFRKGLWGSRKTRPDKWDTYLEMTRSAQQASDHGAVFIDLDL